MSGGTGHCLTCSNVRHIIIRCKEILVENKPVKTFILKSSAFLSLPSVYKDADSLSEKVKTQLLPPQDRTTGQRPERTRRREEEEAEEQRRSSREDSDPLRLPSRHPPRQPHWWVMMRH